MGLDTKITLSCNKFYQPSNDILTLTGCTKEYGQFVFMSGSSLSVLNNRATNKLLTSDANGLITLQFGCANNICITPTSPFTGCTIQAFSTEVVNAINNVANEYTITGNGVLTGFTVAHNKNNQYVGVQIIKNVSPYPNIYTSVIRPNTNCVCITFDNPPANGLEYKVLVFT